jgi:hypothetical protein
MTACTGLHFYGVRSDKIFTGRPSTYIWKWGKAQQPLSAWHLEQGILPICWVVARIVPGFVSWWKRWLCAVRASPRLLFGYIPLFLGNVSFFSLPWVYVWIHTPTLPGYSTVQVLTKLYWTSGAPVGRTQTYSPGSGCMAKFPININSWWWAYRFLNRIPIDPLKRRWSAKLTTPVISERKILIDLPR